MAVVLLTAPIEQAPFYRAHSGSRRGTQRFAPCFSNFLSTRMERHATKGCPASPSPTPIKQIPAASTLRRE
jgi:hypothetical protein